jgi:hypothetical protein
MTVNTNTPVGGSQSHPFYMSPGIVSPPSGSFKHLDEPIASRSDCKPSGTRCAAM